MFTHSKTELHSQAERQRFSIDLVYVLLRLRVQNRRKNGISRLISKLLRTLDSFLRDRLFDVTECRTVAYPGDFRTP